MKDIPGFEGKYAATRDGKIWSYPKIVGKGLRSRGMWLKPYPNNAGYMRVCLGGRNKRYFVHRMIATTFLSLVEGKPIVNHKNGKFTDNRASNLEWCTMSENQQHSYDIGIHKPRGKNLNPNKHTT